MVAEEKINLIEVPHEGKYISFAYPGFEGKDYKILIKAIEEANLIGATSGQIASLVHFALQKPDKERVIDSMKRDYILNSLKNYCINEFTGNLYIPKKKGEILQNGIILEDNPKIINGKFSMSKDNLVKRLINGKEINSILYSDDKSVRFVPFGFKNIKQPISNLTKNKYIIARYGEEGAEKLAEIASMGGRKKYWLFVRPGYGDEVYKGVRRSLLLWGYDNGYDYHSQLHINGECKDKTSYEKECVFGIKRN